MKLTITVPTTLSDMTLHQYQMFVDIQNQNDDQTFIFQKMIEIFCGLDLKDTFKLKVSDVSDISQSIIKILETKPDLIQRFWYNEIEYGFIPNLEEITLGEFVDLESYMKEWKDMHLAMNVLYRPITISKKGKYQIKDYEASDTDIMKKMPLDVCFSSLLFFYNLGIDLSSNLMDYLEEEQWNNLSQIETSSTKGGVGIQQFTNSLKEILQSSKISPNKI